MNKPMSKRERAEVLLALKMRGIDPYGLQDPKPVLAKIKATPRTPKSPRLRMGPNSRTMMKIVMGGETHTKHMSEMTNKQRFVAMRTLIRLGLITRKPLGCNANQGFEITVTDFGKEYYHARIAA